MITLDTSAILALLNRGDPDHQAVLGAFEADRGPHLVPAGILAEVGYMVGMSLGRTTVASFLSDLEAGAFTLEETTEADLGRSRELIGRYEDLELGLADAVVIACAERSGGRVLTIDRRDFDVVAGEGAIEIAP